MALDDLTDKQRMFLEYYLGSAHLNATRAARMAGYAEPNVQGPRLLVDVRIREAVSERLNKAAMTADEVLERLARHAKSTPDDVLDDRGAFSIERARETGAIDLIREYACEEVYEAGVGDNPPALVRKQKVKLVDAQAALVTLGKHHRLWIERTEQSGPNGAPQRVELTEIVVRKRYEDDDDGASDS